MKTKSFSELKTENAGCHCQDVRRNVAGSREWIERDNFKEAREKYSVCNK